VKSDTGEHFRIAMWRFDSFLLLPPLICAALLLAGNENFGFDPAGMLDPFMYFGYFWHYPDHAPRLTFDYKASRLPWIVPGYVAHAIASPTVASYLLVFATLSAGGAALYLIVRDITRNRAAAAVIGAAWTSCSWVHGIGGWNYHMLAAADYFLVANWLTIRTARTHSTWSGVMTGVFAAAAIHTHLLFASLMPLAGVIYWWGPEARASKRDLTNDIARGLAGALGVTFLLAIVNVTTGGDWLFFMPQLLRARQLLRHDNWWLEAREWMPRATYLIVPAAFMIASAVTFLRPGRPRAARAVVLQSWAACGIMCVAQFGRQQAVLDHGYLAFPLYIYAFICGGVLLAWPNPGLRNAHAVAMAGAMVAPLLLLMPGKLPAVMSLGAAVSLPGMADVPVLPPLAFAAAGSFAMLAAPAPARSWIFAAWFAVLNAWIAPQPDAYGIRTPGYQRQMLELFRQADGLTAAFDPNLDGIKYWFGDERVSTRGGEVRLEFVFDSYVSTRGWQANLLGEDRHPPLEELTLLDLERARCVALLTSPKTSEETEVRFLEHFAALGRPLRRVTARHLSERDLSFDIVILKPDDVPDRRGPPCRRGERPSD
jgi:hypothetical protein